VTELLRRNALIAGLAVLCGLLGAIVVIELLAFGESPDVARPGKASAAEAKLLPPLAAAAPENAYPETAARPLWIPTRRPAPVVAAASQPSFQRGQYILQGVTIAGPTRIAMLKEKASGRVHRVELGRELNGLRLAEVEPEQVTLTQGAEREVIDLRVQRLAPVAQGAAAVPGRPVQPPGSPPAGAFAAAAAGIPGPVGPLPTPASAPPPAAPAPAPAPPIATGPMPAQTPVQPAQQGGTPPQSAAPMTPEELLARRRARRNQPTE
jgi:hypothetical protein